VDQPFLVGLGKYHPFLTNNLHDTKMRVTVVYYNEPTNDYRLVWSFSNNSNKPKIKQSDLSTFANVIPVLANADSAIIVETWMDYTPPFQVGITGGEFANRVITSPRFVPQLLWAS
jgi:hypothetical protein